MSLRRVGGGDRLVYRQQFPDGSFDMILVEGQPAGRLSIDRRLDRIRIIDIALLPRFHKA